MHSVRGANLEYYYISLQVTVQSFTYAFERQTARKEYERTASQHAGFSEISFAGVIIPLHNVSILDCAPSVGRSVPLVSPASPHNNRWTEKENYNSPALAIQSVV